MRGKDGHVSCVGIYRGITPAHAGKSVGHGLSAVGNTDHPRTCGEKYYAGDFRFGCWGSPPHMRGKDLCRLFRLVHLGITPAHAGKSALMKAPGVRSGDHPRTCGEKATLKDIGGNSAGSPPHMRGNDYNQVSAVLYEGITPAHAGKSMKGYRKPW